MASIGNKNKSVSAANAIPATVRKIATAVPDTHNKAGGQAFKMTPHYQLAFLMMTSFVEDQFYRTKTDTLKELNAAIDKVEPEFAAKAAIFARTQYGMRSITHAAAAQIAKNVKGSAWTKNFFNKVVYRVDDAAEILAAYLHLHGKPIPNSLKKGLALAMSKFDRYQLAKYKGQSDSVKLVDLFNLVHPKPNEDNAKNFKDLMEGNLASEDTWEAKLSEAGQVATNADDKAKLKTKAWKELLTDKKLGYFALLRNLRNILQTGDADLVEMACVQLVNEKAIKKSLVLPFRFLTAQKELNLTVDSNSRKILKAVNDAVEISLSNVPVFPGETLVSLDISGSMSGKPAEIGALFAAVLAKANNADLQVFHNNARLVNVNLSDSVMSIVNSMRFDSGGTNFNSIFTSLKKKYDRIIILSDMQAWVGYYSPQATYQAYCQQYKANPKIYAFDLAGYGTMQFPGEGIYQLSGFSDKTMDLLKVLEHDPAALLKQINAIEL